MNNSVAIFTKAAQMLAEADTIQKAKELKNLALTAADWAKRKGMGANAIALATSYSRRAEIRMGELLDATDRANAARDKKKAELPNVTPPPTLSEIGVAAADWASSLFDFGRGRSGLTIHLLALWAAAISKRPMLKETPDTIHGRLMESVHISGYSMERACREFEWLLEQNRWQKCGSGFENIHDFLKTIDLSEFRIHAERRKKLALKLAKIDASQRQTAKLLGVGQATISRDIDSNESRASQKANEQGASKSKSDSNESPSFETSGADVASKSLSPATIARLVVRTPPRNQSRFNGSVARPRPAARLPK